jgi:hypothetical protein
MGSSTESPNLPFLSSAVGIRQHINITCSYTRLMMSITDSEYHKSRKVQAKPMKGDYPKLPTTCSFVHVEKEHYLWLHERL